MIQILQRYVLKDVLRTFLLAVTVFTAIVLLGIIYEFVRAELSLGQMIRLIPYGLPFTLPFTLPIAALLATSLTYGRLSVDNEINAIRTSGVPLYVIILPIIIFGVLVSAGSLYLQDDVIPPLHYKLRNIRMLAAEILMDQKEGYNFRRKFGNFQIFASFVRGSEYRGLVVFIRKRNEIMKFVAERAEVRIGEDGNSLDIVAYNARFVPYPLGRPGASPDDRKTEHESPLRTILPRHVLTIPIRPRALRESDKSTEDLFEEAYFHRAIAEEAARAARPAILQERGVLAALERDLAAASKGPERTALEKEVKAQRQRIYDLERPESFSMGYYRKNVAEAMGRRSLALGCLLSVILGSTLPILMRPRNALIPFFAGVLIVIVFYFPMHRLGIGLSERGMVSPWVGPWIPDLLGGGLAGYLLWRVLSR